MMIDEKIQPPIDHQAVRIVGLIGEAHEGQVPTGPQRADLVRALARALDTGDTACPSDGQAAAAALEILAKDPQFAGPIDAIAHGPQVRSMGPGIMESAYLIPGLLVVLQTQFEFARDKDGRWSVKIKKKAPSDALLKPLVKKLAALLGLSG
jgi:hypothetical protein